MADYLLIIIGAILVNNYLLSKFLGICPFLGITNKIENALGMAYAVTFVIVLSGIICWLLNYYVLIPWDLAYLQTIVFILVIAALVQLVEIVVRKTSPTLYNSLGIFLPLITTNCAVLGVSLLFVMMEYNLMQSTVYAVAASVGYGLVLVLFAGMRDRVDRADVPKYFKGMPATLVNAGMLSLAFMGFSGLVK